MIAINAPNLYPFSAAWQSLLAPSSLLKLSLYSVKGSLSKVCDLVSPSAGWVAHIVSL